MREYEGAVEVLARYLADQSGESAGFADAVLRVKLHAAQILCHKQHDYGPGNINGRGLVGVAVRATDKIERLWNLTSTGRDPKNESILDTLLDIENYGTIGTMYHTGTWPGSPRYGGTE
jgi:hypothetical protein